MKAISLHQPWASLIALGAKQIETRSWRPPDALYGQRIAIHAAKRWTEEQQILCLKDPFDCCLKAGGYRARTVDRGLPFGAIVATAMLTGWIGSEDVYASHTPQKQDSGFEWNGARVYAYPYEFAFGNLHRGRCAWLLSDIKALPEPIPCRGKQGFFEVEI